MNHLHRKTGYTDFELPAYRQSSYFKARQWFKLAKAQGHEGTNTQLRLCGE